MLGMRKPKQYYFLIDNLNENSAVKLKQSLKEISFITNLKTSLSAGILEVTAKQNPEDQVKMACKIAGCGFRTAVNRKQL